MAKSRAQRKAEQERRRRAGLDAPQSSDSQAQHDTQVPESPVVLEAELAERGANLDELTGPPAAKPAEPAAEAPAAGDKISRRAAKREDRDRRDRAKLSEQRRRPREEPAERKKRGRVIGFFISCWAELKRVQWPDRETLIQASAVTLLFIAVVGAYLGALDAVFNKVVQAIL